MKPLSIGLFLSFILEGVNTLKGQPPLIVNGNAFAISENCYRITPNESNQIGSAWCIQSLNLEYAFSVNFSANLGCDKTGNQGLAFVLQASPDSLAAIGCGGNRLGYGKNNGCKGISPSLAIEVDTYNDTNEKVPDTYNEHLTITANGNVVSNVVTPVLIKKNSVSIKDCEFHNFIISWKPSTKTLQVLVDNELRLSYKENIQSVYFPISDKIFFGFTGSTGTTITQGQEICFNDITVEIDEAYMEQKKFEQALTVYRNPLTEQITIGAKFESSQNLVVSLYNTQGKKIYALPKKEISLGGITLDMAGLPSGTYIVAIENNKHRTTQRIYHKSTHRA